MKRASDSSSACTTMGGRFPPSAGRRSSDMVSDTQQMAARAFSSSLKQEVRKSKNILAWADRVKQLIGSGSDFSAPVSSSLTRATGYEDLVSACESENSGNQRCKTEQAHHTSPKALELNRQQPAPNVMKKLAADGDVSDMVASRSIDTEYRSSGAKSRSKSVTVLRTSERPSNVEARRAASNQFQVHIVPEAASEPSSGTDDIPVRELRRNSDRELAKASSDVVSPRDAKRSSERGQTVTGDSGQPRTTPALGSTRLSNASVPPETQPEKQSPQVTKDVARPPKHWRDLNEDRSRPTRPTINSGPPRDKLTRFYSVQNVNSQQLDRVEPLDQRPVIAPKPTSSTALDRSNLRDHTESDSEELPSLRNDQGYAWFRKRLHQLETEIATVKDAQLHNRPNPQPTATDERNHGPPRPKLEAKEVERSDPIKTSVAPRRPYPKPWADNRTRAESVALQYASPESRGGRFHSNDSVAVRRPHQEAACDPGTPGYSESMAVQHANLNTVGVRRPSQESLRRPNPEPRPDDRNNTDSAAVWDPSPETHAVRRPGQDSTVVRRPRQEPKSDVQGYSETVAVQRPNAQSVRRSNPHKPDAQDQSESVTVQRHSQETKGVRRSGKGPTVPDAHDYPDSTTVQRAAPEVRRSSNRQLDAQQLARIKKERKIRQEALARRKRATDSGDGCESREENSGDTATGSYAEESAPSCRQQSGNDVDATRQKVPRSILRNSTAQHDMRQINGPAADRRSPVPNTQSILSRSASVEPHATGRPGGHSLGRRAAVADLAEGKHSTVARTRSATPTVRHQVRQHLPAANPWRQYTPRIIWDSVRPLFAYLQRLIVRVTLRALRRPGVIAAWRATTLIWMSILDDWTLFLVVVLFILFVLTVFSLE